MKIVDAIAEIMKREGVELSLFDNIRGRKKAAND